MRGHEILLLPMSPGWQGSPFRRVGDSAGRYGCQALMLIPDHARPRRPIRVKRPWAAVSSNSPPACELRGLPISSVPGRGRRSLARLGSRCQERGPGRHARRRTHLSPRALLTTAGRPTHSNPVSPHLSDAAAGRGGIVVAAVSKLAAACRFCCERGRMRPVIRTSRAWT